MRVKAGVLALILGLPVVGALLAGRITVELLRFPPSLEIPTGYMRFSWFAAAAVTVVLVATFLPWCRRRHGRTSARGDNVSPAASGNRANRLPLWGVLAIGWTLAWWVLAWTRWPWFAAGQLYTFFPLWLGLVITMNALTHARTGSCLMVRAPGPWLALFGASAGCWWVFEWLNRFVRNWHYLNAESFGPLAYALHATLCFATVLPAIAAIAEWLQAHPRWLRWTATGPQWQWMAHPHAPRLLAGAGIAGLLGAGALPDWFYPALWVAPLALLLAAPGAGGAHVAKELSGGDWRRVGTWMTAALICGFFWELWNWHSLAKWIYTVPGVERWHLFEMPALGYVGYLPFGLECLLVTEWAIGRAWQGPALTTEPE